LVIVESTDKEKDHSIAILRTKAARFSLWLGIKLHLTWSSKSGRYYFDYVDLGSGPRPLKVNLSGSEFDSSSYDEYHGDGLAASIISNLRKANEFKKEDKDSFSLFQRKANKAPSFSMVKLKNGSEVAEPLVTTTMMNLELLMEKNPIAFYELVEKCRNPKHEMFGNTAEVAEGLALMNNRQCHSTTRDIVLSAVHGEDLEMTLGSPIEKRGIENKR
jgi:hypothetical protein